MTSYDASVYERFRRRSSSSLDPLDIAGKLRVHEAFAADAGGGSISIATERGTKEQKHQTASPIFLHSTWRASHTWFWLKFRKHSSTVCFYEPFHEGLADLTRPDSLLQQPEPWNASKDPAAELYFHEFGPLTRKAGGVRLFAPEISYQWYLPVGGPAGSLRLKEIKYLALLIRHANRLGRVPVFGFTRSLARLAAIKNQFPGVHIFQYRNLWTQWMSWKNEMQQENRYFFQRMLQIMIGASGSYLSMIIKRKFPRIGADMVAEHDAEILAIELLASISDHQLFTLYMAFHVYLYIHAQKYADIVIDITKAARHQNYRSWVCRQLVNTTGLPITLDDVSEIQRYHPFDPTLIDWKEIRENLELAVDTLDHPFDRQKLWRYGTRLVDDTRTEIRTSEKYVAIIRDEVMTLRNERDSARSALTQATAQSERWFNAAVVWPSKQRFPSYSVRLGQWLQRLKLRFCTSFTGEWIGRANFPASPRRWANGARDLWQWELAARFYADELNRNYCDPAMWVQFGHALREVNRLFEAETAYRTAVIQDGTAIDALLSLGHVLTLQQKRAEALPIYTQALDLEMPSPLRSAIVKEIKVLRSPTETTPQ